MKISGKTPTNILTNSNINSKSLNTTLNFGLTLGFTAPQYKLKSFTS